MPSGLQPVLSLENHRPRDGVSRRLIGSRPDPGHAQSDPDQISLFVFLVCITLPVCIDDAFVWRSSSCTRVLAGALWVRRIAPTRDLGRLVAHGLRSAHDALIDINELSQPSLALAQFPREPAELRENQAKFRCCCSAGRGISVCPRGDPTSRPRCSSMHQRVLPKLPTRRGEAPCVEEHEASSLSPWHTHDRRCITACLSLRVLIVGYSLCQSELIGPGKACRLFG